MLNPNVKVILRAERKSHAALFLFSPQPGNYDVTVPSGFKLVKGERVKFSCPICSHDLTSARDRDMAEIDFVGPSGRSGTVVFSRQYGHHETYFVTREDVRPFGEHLAPEGVNFWGTGPAR
jgi:hypothetical protein